MATYLLRALLVLMTVFATSRASARTDDGGFFSAATAVERDGEETIYVSKRGPIGGVGNVLAFRRDPWCCSANECDPDQLCNDSSDCDAGEQCLALKWFFAPQGQPLDVFYAPPTVVAAPAPCNDNIVFVGSNNNHFYAIRDRPECIVVEFGVPRIREPIGADAKCVRWADLEGNVQMKATVDPHDSRVYVGTKNPNPSFFSFAFPTFGGFPDDECHPPGPSPTPVMAPRTDWPHDSLPQGKLRFEPIVDRQRCSLYVGAEGGGLYALHITTGELLWKFDENKKYVMGGVLSADGRFLYTANNDDIVKLDLGLIDKDLEFNGLQPYIPLGPLCEDANFVDALQDPLDAVPDMDPYFDGLVWRATTGAHEPFGRTKVALSTGDPPGCESVLMTHRQGGALFRIRGSGCEATPARGTDEGRCAPSMSFSLVQTASFDSPVPLSKPGDMELDGAVFQAETNHDCFYAVKAKEVLATPTPNGSPTATPPTNPNASPTPIPSPNLTTGKERWKFEKLWDWISPFGNDFFTTPATSHDGNIVYIGGESGHFFALETDPQCDALPGGDDCDCDSQGEGRCSEKDNLKRIVWCFDSKAPDASGADVGCDLPPNALEEASSDPNACCPEQGTCVPPDNDVTEVVCRDGSGADFDCNQFVATDQGYGTAGDWAYAFAAAKNDTTEATLPFSAVKDGSWLNTTNGSVGRMVRAGSHPTNFLSWDGNRTFASIPLKPSASDHVIVELMDQYGNACSSFALDFP